MSKEHSELSLHKARKIKRRNIFIGLSSMGSLLAGCSRLASAEGATSGLLIVGVGVRSTSEYDLNVETDSLVDQNIARAKHPFLTSLKFSFDESRSGGSLKMDSKYKAEGELRLVTHEDRPRAGWIYCYPHLLQLSETLHPVIGMEVGDEELIHLGYRAASMSYLEGYKGMRSYLIKRLPDGTLAGRFVGLRDLNPDDLVPRDQQAEGYFKKDGLI